MGHIEVVYAEGDRFVVGIRDHDVVIDQPGEAGGDDIGPTPTELFVASLAACIGFYAERFLRRHRLPAAGLKVDCSFSMSEDRPARVASIELDVQVPDGLPEARREAFLAVIDHCVVHNSLRQPPEVKVAVRAREPVAA